MPRKNQVTRTIPITTAKLLLVDVESNETRTEEVQLPRTYKDEKCLLKAAKKAVETETVKCVHVLDTLVTETLYGMDEADFIKYAEILPPRNTNQTAEKE